MDFAGALSTNIKHVTFYMQIAWELMSKPWTLHHENYIFSYFLPIQENLMPQKFIALQYLATYVCLSAPTHVSKFLSGKYSLHTHNNLKAMYKLLYQ